MKNVFRTTTKKKQQQTKKNYFRMNYSHNLIDSFWNNLGWLKLICFHSVLSIWKSYRHEEDTHFLVWRKIFQCDRTTQIEASPIQIETIELAGRNLFCEKIKRAGIIEKDMNEYCWANMTKLLTINKPLNAKVYNFLLELILNGDAIFRGRKCVYAFSYSR